jgi:hypothetical protein
MIMVVAQTTAFADSEANLHESISSCSKQQTGSLLNLVLINLIAIIYL